MRIPRHYVHAAALALIVPLVACGDKLEPSTELRRHDGASEAFYDCDATLRLITYEDDDEYAPKYAWPPQADTVDICESWVGNDYRFAIRTVGTSEAASGVYDWARDGSYENGTITVTQFGSPQQSYSAGSSLFDVVNADSYQVQASYDDPFYGIRALGGDVSGGGGGGEICPPDCMTSPVDAGSALGDAKAEGGDRKEDKFKRHGLRRKGVRALVENFEEDGRSNEGRRRFVKSDKHGKHVIEIDPASELLLGESLESKDLRMSTKHKWRRVGPDWVRQETAIETRDGTGKFIGRSLLLFSDVRINAQ